MDHLSILNTYRSEGRNRQQYNNSRREFNTPLSIMGRSSRQKINKEMWDLKHILDQVELRNSLRACHPIATKYTFFSCTQGIFSRMSIWWRGGVMHVWRQGIYGNSFSSPSGNLIIWVLRHFAIVLQVPEALFILKFQFSFSLFRLSHWYCPILKFSDSTLFLPSYSWVHH